MTERKKVVITDEIRNKLLGFVPISKEIGVAFTPAKFKKEEFKEFAPVFRLRGWTTDEMEQFYSEDKPKGAVNELVRKAILGFENVIHFTKCEEIPFEKDDRGILKKEIFEEFPVQTQNALMFHILKISGLQAEEKENLE